MEKISITVFTVTTTDVSTDGKEFPQTEIVMSRKAADEAIVEWIEDNAYDDEDDMRKDFVKWDGNTFFGLENQDGRSIVVQSHII